MLNLEKLKEIENKYEEVLKKLADPQIISNPKEYQRYAQLHSQMSDLIEAIKRYKNFLKEIDEVEEMIAREKEAEMEKFLREELETLRREKERAESDLKERLIGRDTRDEKDVIMEIRAGAGGEEASLFGADLFRMYGKYAEKQGWKTEVMSVSPSDMGGFKEIIFEVKGKGAYSKLKFESGVHRVQRIPVTESGGRIHTSTSTVAVLPEPEEIEVEIDPKDLKIETFRASGPGGQHVNVTDSAVRITHLPTGIVAQCQEERSQIQNREKAMKILLARLYEKFQREQEEEIAQARRSQVGRGERSEKIRTYNFPQNRVTDHRIGLTLYNLERVLEGEIDEIIEALASADKAEKLKSL